MKFLLKNEIYLFLIGLKEKNLELNDNLVKLI